MADNILIVVSVVLAVVAVGFAFTAWSMAKTIKTYKNRLEKLSVNNDTSSTRVEVLEAKIKTLETALQKALDK